MIATRDPAWVIHKFDAVITTCANPEVGIRAGQRGVALDEWGNGKVWTVEFGETLDSPVREVPTEMLRVVYRASTGCVM